MADYAVMPVIDYEDACDAIREKDGSTAAIKSGEMGGKIRAIDTATEPEITVSSAGLITATSGTKSATKQLDTQAATTITPGTENKTAVSSGKYTTGAVTVKGDANLKAENVASGVSIFGVEGSANIAQIQYEIINISSAKVGYFTLDDVTMLVGALYSGTIGKKPTGWGTSDCVGYTYNTKAIYHNDDAFKEVDVVLAKSAKSITFGINNTNHCLVAVHDPSATSICTA